jgi:hypothetical protein
VSGCLKRRQLDIGVFKVRQVNDNDPTDFDTFHEGAIAGANAIARGMYLSLPEDAVDDPTQVPESALPGVKVTSCEFGVLDDYVQHDLGTAWLAQGGVTVEELINV